MIKRVRKYMTYIYKDNQLEIAEKAKKRFLIFYFILFAVFCGAVVTITVTAQAQSYIYNLIANIALSTCFVFFSLFFIGIKVNLTKKHIALFKMIEKTTIEKVECEVISKEQKQMSYMGLDFAQLKIKCLGSKKDVIRRVFYQAKADINRGDCLVLELCSNIIIGYGKGVCDNG